MQACMKLSKDKEYYRADVFSASTSGDFEVTDVSYFEESMYALLQSVEERDDRFFFYEDLIEHSSDHFSDFVDSGRDVILTLSQNEEGMWLGIRVDDFGSLWLRGRAEEDGLVIEVKSDLASVPLLNAIPIAL